MGIIGSSKRQGRINIKYHTAQYLNLFTKEVERLTVRFLVFLIILLMASDALSMSASKHLLYWNMALPLELKVGGLEDKLTEGDLLRLHKHIDIDHGSTGVAKRHTRSHNPRSVADWAGRNGMNSQAAYNAAVIHILADMADPGPAGVNGHDATKKRRNEAENALARLANGKSPMKGVFWKSWPKWAEITGPRFKSLKNLKVKLLKEKDLLVKVLERGNKVVKIVTKGATIFTFVYESGKLIHTELYTEEGVSHEDIAKSLSGGGGGVAGAWAGSKIGSRVCAPLFSIEPGGPIFYSICVAGFGIGGAIGGSWVGEKIVELVFYEKDDALSYIQSDEDISVYLESEGYVVKSGFLSFYKIFSAVLVLIFAFIYYKKRKTKELFFRKVH